jgi:hypothetical protein
MAETKEESTGSANGGANKGAGEKTKLFREKNLERLESPEQLNDYLRVTSPGVWMILSAVVLLLIGVFIWGVFGRIEATTQAVVVTENGESTCIVPEQAIKGVLQYRTVKIDGVEKELVPDVLAPEVIKESTNVYVMITGGLKVGDIVYPINLAEPLGADGITAGTLVTEELSPIELFFN